MGLNPFQCQCILISRSCRTRLHLKAGSIRKCVLHLTWPKRCIKALTCCDNCLFSMISVYHAAIRRKKTSVLYIIFKWIPVKVTCVLIWSSFEITIIESFTARHKCVQKCTCTHIATWLFEMINRWTADSWTTGRKSRRVNLWHGWHASCKIKTHGEPTAECRAQHWNPSFFTQCTPRHTHRAEERGREAEGGRGRGMVILQSPDTENRKVMN